MVIFYLYIGNGVLKGVYVFIIMLNILYKYYIYYFVCISYSIIKMYFKREQMEVVYSFMVFFRGFLKYLEGVLQCGFEVFDVLFSCVFQVL